MKKNIKNIENKSKHFEYHDFFCVDFSSERIEDLSFTDCKFIKCNFAGVHIKKCQFDGCKLINCNLSNVKPVRSQFIDTSFSECKILGVNWSETALSSQFKFYKCKLDYNIFTNQNLSNFQAIECSIREAFFSGCNLSKSLFTLSDLTNTYFDECKFKYADFINSINFFITPDNNDIRYAKVSVETALGLLEQFHLTIINPLRQR